MLRDLSAKDETLDVVRVFKEHWQALARSYAPGLAEDASTALAQELMRDPAYDEAAELFQSIGQTLKGLWLPRLRLALAEAAMEGTENPSASTVRHRSHYRRLETLASKGISKDETDSA